MSFQYSIVFSYVGYWAQRAFCKVAQTRVLHWLILGEIVSGK